MFSATEYQYTRDIVLTQYNANNTYYLCHTENSNANSYENYDVACYFSDIPITKISDYSFTIPSETLKIELDSSSYSSNNNIPKIKKTTLSTQNITINDYEYIYSNLGTNADILADINYNKDNNLAYNLDLNYSYLILVLLILPIIINFLHHYFYLNNER